MNHEDPAKDGPIDTASELRSLKKDAESLRIDLTDLQRANARLASLLHSQRKLMKNLVNRLNPMPEST